MLSEPLPHGFEHVDRTDNIDARAEHRVGAAEGDLERGEVDDARDRVLVERAPEGVEVGDVAAHERQLLELFRREDELEAVHRVAEVVADGLVAVVEHRLHRPRADAPERTSDQHTLSHRPAPRPENTRARVEQPKRLLPPEPSAQSPNVDRNARADGVSVRELTFVE